MEQNEILQQILMELKNVRESQAVLEREVGNVKLNQQMTTISLDKLDRNQAVIEQSQAKLATRMSAIEEELQSVRNSQLKVELEQYPRIGAALDGVLAGIEKNQTQDERIEAIEKKADNHDARLWGLEQKVV